LKVADSEIAFMAIDRGVNFFVNIFFKKLEIEVIYHMLIVLSATIMQYMIQEINFYKAAKSVILSIVIDLSKVIREDWF